jgi:hypothetical protein
MPVSVLLCLHVGVCLLIAAALLRGEAEVFAAGLRAELILFLFAFLYLFLALVSVVPSYRWKFGVALSVVAVPLLGTLLAALLQLTGGLPRSGWFVVVSLMDSLGFLLLQLVNRRATRSPQSA